MVFSRYCICRLEVTASIETLEDRGVEAGVAGLDDTVLVLNPHEHVVGVEEVLTGLILIRVSTEAQGVVAFFVGLAVDRLEDVLGVGLEHFLGFFGQLVRVVLELLLQSLVGCSAVLGQGRCVDGVAIGSWVLGNRVTLRAGCWEAPVRAATGFEPHLAGKNIGFAQLGGC